MSRVHLHLIALFGLFFAVAVCGGSGAFAADPAPAVPAPASQSGAAAPAPGAAAQPTLPEFNQIVLSVLKEYPTNGTHDYWWPRAGESDYSGCTRDLSLAGVRVMKGEPQRRTYCCGLTLEVFLRSYIRWLETRGGEQASAVAPAAWPEFQKYWFVLEKNGPGPSAALEKFKLGRTIPMNEALPGDFVQIWRTPNSKGKVSGHSVIFLEWVKNGEDDVIGFRYWSTQPGTKGISERAEYYGPFGGVSTENTHFGRVEPIIASAAASGAAAPGAPAAPGAAANASAPAPAAVPAAPAPAGTAKNP